VSSANRTALDNLSHFQARFQANECASGVCPAVECEPAVSAACVGDSESTGVCQDQFGG
jgi:hypothetical protein